jgi:hypothetical protein
MNESLQLFIAFMKDDGKLLMVSLKIVDPRRELILRWRDSFLQAAPERCFVLEHCGLHLYVYPETKLVSGVYL